MNEQQIKELALEAATNTLTTAYLYFPHHFERDFCGLHHKLFDLVDNPMLRCVAAAAPRGIGKTTLFMVGNAGRRALYGLNKFIVMVSATLDHSIEQLRTLKAEIEQNDVIRFVFGDLKGDIWREDRIKLRNGVYILARGAEQQIRGLKHGNQRPDLILCDDMETSEGVMNEDRRKKLMKWFFSDLLRAGARSGMEAEVKLIGTVLHEDSLLQNLLESDHWHTIRLEAFDDDYKPTWPEYMNEAEVSELYQHYKELGMLDELFREYRNLPISQEDKVFPNILHYGPGDQIYQMVTKAITSGDWLRFVIVDPAKTVNVQSDPSAILGYAHDSDGGVSYMHDLVNGKLSPEAVLEEAFDMADRLRTDLVFVEETGLNLWMTTVARTVMARRARSGKKGYYNLVPLKAQGKKEDRIARLAPLHKIGAIMHNEAVSRPIDSQLAAFPRSRYDDCMDAEAYLIPILRDGGRGHDMTPNEDYSPPQARLPRSTMVTPGEWNIV